MKKMMFILAALPLLMGGCGAAANTTTAESSTDSTAPATETGTPPSQQPQTSQQLQTSQQAESGSAAQSTGFMHISQDQAKQMMEEEKDFLLVDVRTKEEFEEGHIPGAINLPVEEIGDSQPQLLPNKDQVLLLYCRSGRRSQEAANKLAGMGYTKVYEFGGIMDWTGETEK